MYYLIHSTLQVAVMNATYINERTEILEGYGGHTASRQWFQDSNPVLSDAGGHALNHHSLNWLDIGKSYRSQ